jgi:hypothetical protein
VALDAGGASDCGESEEDPTVMLCAAVSTAPHCDCGQFAHDALMLAGFNAKIAVSV